MCGCDYEAGAAIRAAAAPGFDHEAVMAALEARRNGTIGAWARTRRAQLRLAARIIVACLASFLIAHLLGFQHGYWAVLTAVIVMQASVGGALKAAVDRFVGSLGGAVWGVAAGLLVPHADERGLALALVFAVAPLALLTALRPAYRVAPVTAIIILLTPTGQAAGPLAAAIQRLMEVGLGSLVAIAVSLLVVPARGHNLVADAAGKALELMADLTGVVMAGLAKPIDADRVQMLHDGLRKAIAQAEAAASETTQERSRWLTAAPDQEPLCRTLRRLRNDLAMAGRALARPLDEPARTRLAGPAAEIGGEVASFLRGAATAIGRAAPAPALAGSDRALLDFAAATADLRERGLAKDLPDEMVGRLFGLAFALEQFGQNLADLVDRTGELARPEHG
ncbi:MAG: FUSC family protein [Caulobacteraceae bacterium]|nr:FUSC family protein [Caulobacteraceae bacterium]